MRRGSFTLSLAAALFAYMQIQDAVSAEPVNRGNLLQATKERNAFLVAPDYLSSNNGQYFLWMQSDGNLVLYHGSGPQNNRGYAGFSTNTKDSGGTVLAMQDDGHVVVYKSNPPKSKDEWVYKSESMRDSIGNYFLNVQDDGNVVAYHGTPQSQGTHIWSSRHGVNWDYGRCTCTWISPQGAALGPIQDPVSSCSASSCAIYCTTLAMKHQKALEAGYRPGGDCP